MIRIEKDHDVRRILESLLNQLESRNKLDGNTIQNVVEEGKHSTIINS
jgi:hypothetical protein